MLRKRRQETETFTNFEKDLEKVFDEAFHSMWDLKNRRLEPLAYMNETKDKVIVTVDLPLVKKKDVIVNFSDNMLEIIATMQRCVNFSKWGTSQRTCEFESFYKAVELPARINIEKAKAKFVKGILTIEIPKKTQQHKIDIT